ncbi:MAG: hypothetical protein ACOCVF_03095 [bacterium]
MENNKKVLLSNNDIEAMKSYMDIFNLKFNVVPDKLNCSYIEYNENDTPNIIRIAFLAGYYKGINKKF